MPVEIREIVLQARVVNDETAQGIHHADADKPDLPARLDDLRQQMLIECEQMIRAALDRRSSR